MQHQDFHINMEFVASGGFTWRCTDVGVRTITAICLDPNLSKDWFNGPPYAVAEVVFDEHDMGSCWPSQEELIEDRLASHEDPQYRHPGFDIDDMGVLFHPSSCHPDEMRKTRQWENLLKRDRVDSEGRVWHPFHAVRGALDPRVFLYPAYNASCSDMTDRMNALTNERLSEGDWFVLIFDVMNRVYSAILPDVFLAWPFAKDSDYGPWVAGNNQDPSEKPWFPWREEEPEYEEPDDFFQQKEDSTFAKMARVPKYSNLTSEELQTLLVSLVEKNTVIHYVDPNNELIDGSIYSTCNTPYDWSGIVHYLQDPDWRVGTRYTPEVAVKEWDCSVLEVSYSTPNDDFLVSALTAAAASLRQYYDDGESTQLFPGEEPVGARGSRGILQVIEYYGPDVAGNTCARIFVFSNRIAFDTVRKEVSPMVNVDSTSYWDAVRQNYVHYFESFGYEVVTSQDEHPTD